MECDGNGPFQEASRFTRLLISIAKTEVTNRCQGYHIISSNNFKYQYQFPEKYPSKSVSTIFLPRKYNRAFYPMTSPSHPSPWPHGIPMGAVPVAQKPPSRSPVTPPRTPAVAMLFSGVTCRDFWRNPWEKMGKWRISMAKSMGNQTSERLESGPSIFVMSLLYNLQSWGMFHCHV